MQKYSSINSLSKNQFFSKDAFAIKVSLGARIKSIESIRLTKESVKIL